MCRFIPDLVELLESFHKLHKKNTPFPWARTRKTFKKVKDMVSSHLTMISPGKGFPLTLYLTSTKKSTDALLAQGVEGIELAVYYLSRSLQGAEINYSPTDHHSFELIFVAQKFRYYLLARCLNLVTKSNPLKYLLSPMAMTRSVTRWSCI